MHAVTREKSPHFVAVPTRTGTDSPAPEKVNLRVEGPEVRTARRAVAAYLTACGIREPDAVARHTGRIVKAVVESALVHDRVVTDDVVDRALAFVAVEYLDTTRLVSEQTATDDRRPKAATPAHNRAILGGVPDVWDGSEEALTRATGYLQRNGVTIVPPETRRLMAPPTFGSEEAATGPTLTAIASTAGRAIAGVGRAARRLVGTLVGPVTS